MIIEYVTPEAAGQDGTVPVGDANPLPVQVITDATAVDRGHNTVTRFSEPTPLVAAGATGNGDSHDTGNPTGRYSKFRAGIFTDQAGNLIMQQSDDNVLWRTVSSTAITANTYALVETQVIKRYVRAQVSNTGAAAQTVIDFDTALVGA